MYAEIHRHLVLYKKIPNSCQSLFRQIIVVEREHFEVRVFESDIPQLDTKFVLDRTSAEIQLGEQGMAALLLSHGIGYRLEGKVPTCTRDTAEAKRTSR